MTRKTTVLAFVVLCGTLAWELDRHSSNPSPQRAPAVVVGNPDVLQERYETWKSAVNAGSRLFELGLGTPRGMEGVATGAGGVLRIDLDSGALEARVIGLAGDHDLWLIAGHEGSSLRPSPLAPRICAGRFVASGGELTLDPDLAEVLEQDFAIDVAIVVPAGGDPSSDGVLFGMPSLFQRLLAQEQSLARATERSSEVRTLSLAVMAPVQSGGVPTGFPHVFNDLVARGEDLFFNETFAGNGRTCGTCHPADANFTLNADDIAALPPTDPLFVAEFVPALIASPGGPRFENPVLMRQFGLILENVDGTDDLANKFVMRGIPHTLGMTVSLQRPDGATDAVLQRTGWGGDGAPAGPFGTAGRLVDFAVGAVNQHFTKTTNRTPGTDFRLPTSEELTAMEAFQLSLGRTSDPNLSTLSFRDADVDMGRRLFLLGPGLAGGATLSCNACHGNAGALDTAVPEARNANFNTGVEQFQVNRPDGTGEPRPRDGGFGTDPLLENASFGDQTFNVPSIIEAADTRPFFHNNAVDTLEGTVTFYNTPEFANAFFGLSIPFNATEVTQVAQFMRVINTLDNLDNSAVRLANKAITALSVGAPDNDVVNRLLQLAISDIDDCDDVLTEGNIHGNVLKELKHAKKRFQQAMNTHPPTFVRIDKIDEGLERVAAARALMVN